MVVGFYVKYKKYRSKIWTKYEWVGHWSKLIEILGKKCKKWSNK